MWRWNVLFHRKPSKPPTTLLKLLLQTSHGYLLLVLTFFFPHFPPGGGTYFEATLLVSKVVKSQFSLTHTKNWCTNFYNHHDVCRLKWHILIFRLTLQFTVSYRHEFETGFPAPQTPLHYGTIRILKLCTICA